MELIEDVESEDELPAGWEGKLWNEVFLFNFTH
jgi:hypothetical protein